MSGAFCEEVPAVGVVGLGFLVCVGWGEGTVPLFCGDTMMYEGSYEYDYALLANTIYSRVCMLPNSKFCQCLIPPCPKDRNSWMLLECFPALMSTRSNHKNTLILQRLSMLIAPWRMLHLLQWPLATLQSILFLLHHSPMLLLLRPSCPPSAP